MFTGFFIYRGLRYRISFDWDVEGRAASGNGLLREYFSKGKDLTDITDDYIQNKIDELNKRPRKCLGYKTPYEVYYSTSLHLT